MKKTSNKGFSMVELIIVIAIMAILAAALAPSLIKYINKSRLSTDVQTGTTIASAVNAALAVEKAYDDCAVNGYDTGVWAVNNIINKNDEFAKEMAGVIGATAVKGKSKKDLGGNAMAATEFYVSIDAKNNKVQVWYGATDDAHLVSPNPGASMAE
ncbi:MAG: prepilin-type N-terminal cleavage/methylation domain-containing protein [Lachnospiraceae bacterium]|nr:prepilin-type N-terminal cleavage/methylation domain-containing protein [Lachnospiraceae bacterium]